MARELYTLASHLYRDELSEHSNFDNKAGNLSRLRHNYVALARHAAMRCTTSALLELVAFHLIEKAICACPRRVLCFLDLCRHLRSKLTAHRATH